MDPMLNPFAPGAGARPPELVGRDEILERSRILLGRVKNGRAEKSIILSGLRGVGKTVLLNEMAKQAREAGYHVVFIEASEDKSLALLLAPALRKLLFDLDMNEKVRRGLGVLKGFLGALKVKVAEVEIGLDIDPVRGTADSGDLESDLTNLFIALAEAAQDRSGAIALFIDEMQYLEEKELGALIMAMHKMQQLQLPVVLLGAGLPFITGLAGDAKSYAERLFDFPPIAELPSNAVRKALHDPVHAEGVAFDDPAINKIIELTKGFPYFVQEWGYQSWNHASDARITLANVADATDTALKRLDDNFFRVRFDRLTPREKQFMRAMAELGPGQQRIGNIAEVLGVKVNSLGPIRANLIHKGMIFSPAYGDLAFTVPLFNEFMHRVMPKMEF
jgi:hypothetical protein